MIYTDTSVIPADEAPFMGDENIKMMIDIKKAIMANASHNVSSAYDVDENLILNAMSMGVDNNDNGTTPISSIRVSDEKGEVEYPVITITAGSSERQYAVDKDGRLFSVTFDTQKFGPSKGTIREYSNIALQPHPEDELIFPETSGKLLKSANPLLGCDKVEVMFSSGTSEYMMPGSAPKVFKTKEPSLTEKVSFVRRDNYAIKNNRKGFLAVQSLLTHQPATK